MARKSVADATAKWQSRTAQSQQYYQAGIQNATNWAENAVAAAPRRNQGLQDAISSGRIDKGIQRVGTAGWKNKTLAKGPTNWTQGVQSGGAAYSQGLQRAYGYMDSADAKVAGLPKTTFADRMNRMTQYLTEVHNQAQAFKNANG